MTLYGQNLQKAGYSIIPRTLTFLLSGDQILLIKLSEQKGAWAGQLNGIGGHIEEGENPFHSAQRELLEETGLAAHKLRLCGVAIIDTHENPGVGLLVYVGEAAGELKRSKEGQPIWIPIGDLSQQSLVADLPTILPLAIDIYQNSKPPFNASYHYSNDGELEIKLAPSTDE